MRASAPKSYATSEGWRAAPVVVLLLLSPVIGEVLFGATRITMLFVLIPQIGTWGCASVIIRDVVRRRRGGWHPILLLGIALAVAEECVIQQTSLAPLVGADPQYLYGRALGVNWVYFLWALGYESIWIVVLPIQLTELIFPARRDQPWLGTRGLATSAIVFVSASFVAWYSWTQVFVPRFFPELVYQVPLPAVVMALAAIVAIAAAALIPERSSLPERETARSAPELWLVGLVAFVLALPWFTLIFLAYGAWPTLPFLIPMIAGLALAGVAYFLIAHWSRSPAWHDSSRLALIFGALIASMLAGFLVLKLGGATTIDVIGKLVLNVVAVLLLIGLARRISHR
jgi:hypothetical protein